MKGRTMKIFRDGIEQEIDPGYGIKVSHTRDGHVVERYRVNGVPKYFVTLAGLPHCAHGSTVAEAIADAKWKDPGQRPTLEQVKAKVLRRGRKGKITLSEFRALTGACKEGCLVALNRVGLEPKPMTVDEIRSRVSLEYGNKLLDILGWE